MDRASENLAAFGVDLPWLLETQGSARLAETCSKPHLLYDILQAQVFPYLVLVLASCVEQG